MKIAAGREMRLVFLCVTAAAAGCAPTPKFGGRVVKVTLTDKQAASRAYLIPNERYVADETIAQDPARLQHYFRGTTPITVHLLPYAWNYVVQRPDGSLSAVVTFNPSALPNRVIDASGDMSGDVPEAK